MGMGISDRVSSVRVIVGLGVLVKLVGGTRSSSVPGGRSWSVGGMRFWCSEWMGLHADGMGWIKMRSHCCLMKIRE